MSNRVDIHTVEASVIGSPRSPATSAAPASRAPATGMVARERSLMRERFEQWRRNRQRD